MAAKPNLLFLYLGRRGAMPRFALDLVKASGAPIVIAEDNELASSFDTLASPVFKVRLFSSAPGAVLDLWRAPGVRRALAEAIAETAADYVVDLMPHVWSPLLENVPRRLGVKRAALLHDARAHPGDAFAFAHDWTLNAALRADRIVTLSRYVADAITKARPQLASRIAPLFHPDLAYARTPLPAGGPLRVLFFGRLFAYKGLDLCVGAVERARAGGADIALTVAGEGDISALQPQLDRIGATVINRWLAHDEIEHLLAQCQVVAATYREASQSGIVAAAFGAGRAVIATPVGALPEQVTHERTGLVARDVSAEAVAEMLARLAVNPAELEALSHGVNLQAELQSMHAFAGALERVLAT